MGIGLIVSGRPCTLTLDGWTGEVSGLERIDGQGCDANESTIRTTVFVPGVTDADSVYRCAKRRSR